MPVSRASLPFLDGAVEMAGFLWRCVSSEPGHPLGSWLLEARGPDRDWRPSYRMDEGLRRALDGHGWVTAAGRPAARTEARGGMGS